MYGNHQNFNDDIVYVDVIEALKPFMAVQMRLLETWSHGMNAWAQMLSGPSIRDVTIYFPFGRDYHQGIDPTTNWGGMKTAKTDKPHVEQAIVEEVASYGTQLDQLMELVLELAETTDGVDPEKLKQVQALKAKIDQIKARA